MAGSKANWTLADSFSIVLAAADSGSLIWTAAF
jgi:hypothetical protein